MSAGRHSVMESLSVLQRSMLSSTAAPLRQQAQAQAAYSTAPIAQGPIASSPTEAAATEGAAAAGSSGGAGLEIAGEDDEDTIPLRGIGRGPSLIHFSCQGSCII